jgi:OHCU decarboxylase
VVSRASGCSVARQIEAGVTISLAELNALPPPEAAKVLAECCGSSRWVEEMSGRRPFESKEAALGAANDVCALLDTDDWLEAFARHPRIGERGSALSVREQSGMDEAGDTTREELAASNLEYERRFGFIYIVCATGKTGDEMLALARQRMMNDPEIEISIAAEEQRKITQSRLKTLLAEAS